MLLNLFKGFMELNYIPSYERLLRSCALMRKTAVRAHLAKHILGIFLPVKSCSDAGWSTIEP